MKNLILIDDEKDYTLSEFTHLVRRALSAVANESPDMELVYPGREVYFAIFDLLGYINDRVTGEFRITQTKSKHYQVLYVPEKAARKEADQPMMRSRAATAKLLEEITGRRPNWADGDDNPQNTRSTSGSEDNDG